MFHETRTQGGVGEYFPHAFGVTASVSERHRGRAPLGSEDAVRRQATRSSRGRLKEYLRCADVAEWQTREA